MILSIVDERKRALDAGAAGIVTKPVDRAELLRAIDEACAPPAAKVEAQPSVTVPAVGLNAARAPEGNARCRSY